MSPFVNDPDFVLHVGDALEVLGTLPDESVHCVVTSPPYWGLRDYGTEGQLGLEPTPEEYVSNMVAVFREVRRVLRRDGTCWLNIGDSYTSGDFTRQGKPRNVPQLPNDWEGTELGDRGRAGHAVAVKRDLGHLKPKDLVGIPWRLAFALQADGWYLRSDIIWSKPAPMPESVRDRPTKSHEYVFLLTKSARYYFDQEAVREPHAYDGRRKTTVQGQDGSLQHRDGERWPNSGRNIRTVWTINAEPFTDWGQTVRQRRVAADAPDGGKKRTTSPDCLVHGDRPVPVATAGDGGRADGSSIRTEHTDAGHDQAPLVELVPTGPRLEPDSALESSSSLVPAGSPTATAHNTGTHRTASRSSSRGTASSETSCRTGDTSPSSESPALDGSDIHGSSGTPDRTDCTCTWYVEYTDNTSHFATFPSKLVEPCILAGTSERGCCPACGAPWERETEKVATGRVRDRAKGGLGTEVRRETHELDPVGGVFQEGVAYQTTGWGATCNCGVPGHINRPLEPAPCTVLDPFMGSGTVAVVARRLGRRAVGIELNPEYAKLAAKRLQQLSLLAA